MDKTWKRYAKWKKAVTKDCVLYDSITDVSFRFSYKDSL